MGEQFCWLRFKRHGFKRTGAFRFGPGAFNRGHVLRCCRCGHEIATLNRELLRRVDEASSPPTVSEVG